MFVVNSILPSIRVHSSYTLSTANPTSPTHKAPPSPPLRTYEKKSSIMPPNSEFVTAGPPPGLVIPQEHDSTNVIYTFRHTYNDANINQPRHTIPP